MDNSEIGLHVCVGPTRRDKQTRGSQYSARFTPPRQTRRNCLVRVASASVVWTGFPTTQRLSPTENVKSEHVNSNCPVHSGAQCTHDTDSTVNWALAYSSESTGRNWRYSYTYNDFEDESRQNAGDYRQHSGNQQTEVLSHQQQAATLTPASGRIDAQVWAKIWGKRLKTASYCNVYSVLLSNRVSMTAAWFRVER